MIVIFVVVLINILFVTAQHMRTVGSIDLRATQLGDNGATIVANFITKQEDLFKTETVDNNNNGAAPPSNHNLFIQEINLSNNVISNQGIKSIAKALESSKTVKTINLAANAISNSGAASLARMIERNQYLEV
jgi:hypothetical protein